MKAFLAGALLALASFSAGAADGCAQPVHITIDTGSQSQAQVLADILQRHHVRANFFLANERTVYGDFALDDGWADYWRARVAEGHVFGSHTLRHGRFAHDLPGGAVQYIPQFGLDAGKPLTLTQADVCAELAAVDDRFVRLTGHRLAKLWRAPGGHTTPNTLIAAQSCGWRHVGWSQAGFLGDELPSEQYPNSVLVGRAVRDIKPGDIVMLHMGIWSRKQAFAPALDDVLTGLEARGLCFAPIER
ncbi:MAG TPA: polysaccharide deacetylase family protein [Nevskiaceae bacterium]|nr:polysaccharide deacetylase family protein [Nevskiaceae bacterium]